MGRIVSEVLLLFFQIKFQSWLLFRFDWFEMGFRWMCSKFVYRFHPAFIKILCWNIAKKPTMLMMWLIFVHPIFYAITTKTPNQIMPCMLLCSLGSNTVHKYSIHIFLPPVKVTSSDRYQMWIAHTMCFRSPHLYYNGMLWTKSFR